jgi:cytochrome c biogenesis protein CcmG/thiol:disulfide interchange protein DsbE
MSASSPRRARPYWPAALPVLLFLALAAIFYKQLFGEEPSKVPSALIDKPVPEFTLPGLDGLKSAGAPVPGLAAADLRGGRPTLVNVWASWCGPCRQEHPLLMELSRRGDLRVAGINYKDQAENARRFLGLHGNPFAAVGVDPAGRAAVDWGVYGVPETFLVDGKGVIVFKWVGPLTPAAVAERLAPALQALRPQ